MKFLPRTVFAALIVPLAMTLAACGSDGDSDAGPPEGEPIAAIPAPDGQQWTETASVTEMGGHLLGNPEAPIKLIEYASLTCPHCADFSEEAGAKLRDQYVASGVVSYELRNQVHDGLDLTLSMLVRCGTPQAYFGLSEQVWANLGDIVDGLQSNQPAVQKAMESANQASRYKAMADAAGLTDFFAARGIAQDQSSACLTDANSAKQIVDWSETQSEELGVTGTPFFFLNGHSLGSMSWQQLEPILQKAGAR